MNTDRKQLFVFIRVRSAFIRGFLLFSRRKAGRLSFPRRRRTSYNSLNMTELPESAHPPQDNSAAAEKVRSFPHSPGVYLMKDAAGRVIYIGKAKNLRARAGSYFLKAAAEDQRTARLVQEIRDIDFLEAESEVDALLMEARLIKDLLPKYNRDLRDDKTFPYLEIRTYEDYPRVGVTRTPQERGSKLYGPFTNSRSLRGAMAILQKVFKFRTCSLDIEEGDARWRWFRPCLLASTGQCSAPCNFRISREEYRKNIHRLQTFLEGKRKPLLREMREDMAAAAAELKFEEAARLARRNPPAGNAQRARPPGNPRPAGGLSRRSEKGTRRPAKGPADAKAAAGDRRHRHRPHRRRRHRGQRRAVHRRTALQAGFSADAHPQRRGRSTTWPASTRPCCGDISGSTKRRSCPTSCSSTAARGNCTRPSPRWTCWPSRIGRWSISLAKREELIFRRGSGGAVAVKPSLLRLAAVAVRPRRGAPLCPALSPHLAASVDAGGGWGVVEIACERFGNTPDRETASGKSGVQQRQKSPYPFWRGDHGRQLAKAHFLPVLPIL